jgi:hypothetical protein
LVRGDEAIEKTKKEQAAFNEEKHTPPANQDEPQIAQRGRGGVAACGRRSG